MTPLKANIPAGFEPKEPDSIEAKVMRWVGKELDRRKSKIKNYSVNVYQRDGSTICVTLRGVDDYGKEIIDVLECDSKAFRLSLDLI